MNKRMGRGGASALALVGMAVGAAPPAEAAPKLGHEVGCFPPRTSFGAVAAERLINCPSAGGRGGLVETDAGGTPTRLKYGSVSDGAGIATVIIAASDGFTMLRGAGLQQLRDEKEYRELTTALNDASAQ